MGLQSSSKDRDIVKEPRSLLSRLNHPALQRISNQAGKSAGWTLANPKLCSRAHPIRSDHVRKTVRRMEVDQFNEHASERPAWKGRTEQEAVQLGELSASRVVSGTENGIDDVGTFTSKISEK